jgi:LysM repeat protein
MDRRRRRSPARYLAPLALALAAVALLVVIASSGSGGDDNGDKADTSTRATGRTQPTATTPRPTPATYTVKTDDTLVAISKQTGVSVERLQELNPELDPQALVSGQTIKLRE